MKPLHLPLEGHDLLAVERFKDDTRHMAEFLKDGIDMARDYLRRASVLVVCGGTVDEAMKNDIAVAERLRITATTLDGILTVKGQGREDGGKMGA